MEWETGQWGHGREGEPSGRDGRLGVLTGGRGLTASVSVLGLTASSMSIMLKFKGRQTEQGKPFWARQSNSWKVNNHLLLFIEKLNSLLWFT